MQLSGMFLYSAISNIRRSQRLFWQERSACQSHAGQAYPTECDLLKILIHHTDKVLTYHQLIHELWGTTQYQDAVHLLRVTLSHLLSKLQTDPMAPPHIQAELGVGYRLGNEHLSQQNLEGTAG